MEKETMGTVISVTKQWWLKVNRKPVRAHAMDGAAFPHTIVAVGFEGDVILFNDPAPTSSSAYASDGKYQCVPFEQTCIPSRDIPFEEITFIQAISY